MHAVWDAQNIPRIQPRWTASRAFFETPPVRVLVCSGGSPASSPLVDAGTPHAWGTVGTTERWSETHALVTVPWGDEGREKVVTWKLVAWALEHDKALVL